MDNFNARLVRARAYVETPHGRRVVMGTAAILALLLVWQSVGVSTTNSNGNNNNKHGGGFDESSLRGNGDNTPLDVKHGSNGASKSGEGTRVRGFDESICTKPPQWTDGNGAKVLVTGAAGFIGSHVAVHCAQELGMDVIGVDDMSGGFEYNIDRSSFTFLKGDLQNATFVKELFDTHGPFDYVYHLAAYAAEGLSHFIRGFNYRNNLVATMNVLNEAVNGGTKTFVFTSSIAVYGAGQTPMVEETVPEPEDPYGVAKYAVELDLRAAHEMFGINFVVFRPHNVYGPGQNVADKYRNVIGIFMRQILNGQPMTIFGDGSQTRAFSYIDDVAPYIAEAPLLKSAKNQVFNVGADIPYTLNELAQAVGTAMGLEGDFEVRHLPARNEVAHAHSDHRKLNCFFQPSRSPVTLDEGLAKMSSWVLEKNDEGVFTPVSFNDVEVFKNMPPSWVPKDSKKKKQKE